MASNQFDINKYLSGLLDEIYNGMPSRGKFPDGEAGEKLYDKACDDDRTRRASVVEKGESVLAKAKVLGDSGNSYKEFSKVVANYAMTDKSAADKVFNSRHIALQLLTPEDILRIATKFENRVPQFLGSLPQEKFNYALYHASEQEHSIALKILDSKYLSSRISPEKWGEIFDKHGRKAEFLAAIKQRIQDGKTPYINQFLSYSKILQKLSTMAAVGSVTLKKVDKSTANPQKGPTTPSPAPNLGVAPKKVQPEGTAPKIPAPAPKVQGPLKPPPIPKVAANASSTAGSAAGGVSKIVAQPTPSSTVSPSPISPSPSPSAGSTQKQAGEGSKVFQPMPHKKANEAPKVLQPTAAPRPAVLHPVSVPSTPEVMALFEQFDKILAVKNAEARNKGMFKVLNDFISSLSLKMKLDRPTRQAILERMETMTVRANQDGLGKLIKEAALYDIGTAQLILLSTLLLKCLAAEDFAAIAIHYQNKDVNRNRDTQKEGREKTIYEFPRVDAEDNYLDAMKQAMEDPKAKKMIMAAPALAIYVEKIMAESTKEGRPKPS